MHGTAPLHATIRPVLFRAVCRGCANEHICLPCNLDTAQQQQLRPIIRQPLGYQRGDRIVRMGAPFTSLHIVRSGAVKTQQISPDGELNLTAFHLEGDLFGLDAIGSETYPCEAVALEPTSVCELPYGELERLCARIPPLQHWLLSWLGRQLKANETAGGWSTRKDLGVRVIQFFLDLRQRLDARQRPEDGYYLMPMRKREIALFLKVRQETLSRTLTVLKSRQLVDICSQRFRLADAAVLRRYLGA